LAVGAGWQRQYAGSVPPPSPLTALLHHPPPTPPPPFPLLQSCTQGCLSGSRMWRSLWRLWEAACCPLMSSTGNRAMRPSLRRAASHSARCSYKRHTQRSTHFSALLDACAPPPSPALAPPANLGLVCFFVSPCPSSSFCSHGASRYRDSGGLDTKRSNEEHEHLLRSCGFAIRSEESEVFLLAKDVSGRQLLSSSWYRPVRAAPPQRTPHATAGSSWTSTAASASPRTGSDGECQCCRVHLRRWLTIASAVSFAARRHSARARAARRTAAACASAATGRATDRERRCSAALLAASHAAAATVSLLRCTMSWGSRARRFGAQRALFPAGALVCDAAAAGGASAAWAWSWRENRTASDAREE
jgi:hypothetical protein